MLNRVILIFVILVCTACEDPRLYEIAATPTLSVVFGGDAIVGRRMNPYVTRRGFERSLAGVKKVLSHAELAVVNLEAVISSTGNMVHKGGKNPCFLRGRPELIRVLTSAGVDMVIMDFWP